jgi:hypothetical protein
MTNVETIKKIKLALRSGDQPEIARRTGFSKPWVNQILNCKKGTENEVTQRAVIDAALEIISSRQDRESRTAKENSEKVKAILG